MRPVGCFSLVVLLAGLLDPVQSRAQQAPAPRVDIFSEGHHFGEEVFAMDSRGVLYFADRFLKTITTLDPATGKFGLWQGAPQGAADAIVIAPDGRVFWSSSQNGAVYVRDGEGPAREIASGLRSVHSLALRGDGRLFAAEDGNYDAALFEIDPAGKRPARKIGLIDPDASQRMAALKAKGLCGGAPGLNEIAFAPDGALYGTNPQREIVRIDLDTAAQTPTGVTARTFGFGSDGALYVADSYQDKPSRRVERVDLATGQRLAISAEHEGAITHLRLDSSGDMCAVVRWRDGVAVERLLRRDLPSTVVSVPGIPGDLAIYGEEMFVAEGEAIRRVNLSTGASTIFAARPVLDSATGLDVSERYVHAVSSGMRAVQTFDRKSGELVATRPLRFEAFDVLEMDDGALLVYSFTKYGAILRLPATETGEAEPIFENLSGGPSARLARCDKDHIYFRDAQYVLRLDLNTRRAVALPVDFQGATAFAALPTGELLVLESHRYLAGRLCRVRPGESTKEVIATLPQLHPESSPFGGFGCGLAVAADGSFYVGIAAQQAIFKIPPV
jgi:sugar lactone lactonase YvrE